LELADRLHRAVHLEHFFLANFCSHVRLLFSHCGGKRFVHNLKSGAWSTAAVQDGTNAHIQEQLEDEKKARSMQERSRVGAKLRSERLTPADETSYVLRAGVHWSSEYRSEWWQYRRDQAWPGRRVGRRRRRANASQRHDEKRAGKYDRLRCFGLRTISANAKRLAASLASSNEQEINRG